MKRVVLLWLSSSLVFGGELDNNPIPRLESYIDKIDKQYAEGIVSKELLGIQKKQIEDQIKAHERRQFSQPNHGQ
jgi:hypothetical protein